MKILFIGKKYKILSTKIKINNIPTQENLPVLSAF